MNKETVSYIKHIMSSDYVRLDAFNALLASAIIVLTLLAFFTGNTKLFSAAFFTGSALALFNAVKSVKKRFIMATVGFILMAIALSLVAVFIMKYLAV